VEPEPLDTAGAVRFAACHAGIDERFVVLNGDVLTDLDLGALLAFHDRQGAEGTIALHRVKDPSAFGVVPTDDDGRVVAFVEKPPLGEAPTDLINAGTYVLEPSVIDRIPDGRRVSVERETFPAMVADRSLYALADGEVYWLDLGTPAAYLQAQLDLIDGVRALEASGVDPAAVVTPGAVVQRSVVAGGASVGPGSVVERSAVGARASIGPGAIVRGSVLLPGAKVEAGACVEGSFVGARAVVGAGARLVGGTVVGHDVVVLPGQQLAGVRVPEGT
jgi:NDP-sugar pyrophosphorylase family protein